MDNCFSRLNTEFLASGFQAGAAVPFNTSIVTGLNEAYKHYQSVIYEPRFGIVVTPFGSGKTVVRAGVGLFSSLPPASVSSNIFNNAPNKFSPTVSFGNVGLGTDPSTSQASASASFQAFESAFSKGGTLASISAALAPYKQTFSPPNFYSPSDNFRPPKITEWSLQIEHPLPDRI